MAASKTREYLLLDKHYLIDGSRLERGDTIELTDEQARFLENKVELVERPKQKGKRGKPIGDAAKPGGKGKGKGKGKDEDEDAGETDGDEDL